MGWALDLQRLSESKSHTLCFMAGNEKFSLSLVHVVSTLLQPFPRRANLWMKTMPKDSASQCGGMELEPQSDHA